MDVRTTFSPNNPKSARANFDSENASLVNTANISSIQAMTGLQHKKQISQFTLLGFSKKILTKHNILSPRSDNPHRTRLCHSYRQASAIAPSISLSENLLDSRASITDVQTCGCVWACPVCYERKAVENGLEIQKAIAWAKSEGLTPVLVSLTAAHSNEMSLADFQNPFTDAYRKFTSNRRWRNFKKDFGVVHYIANNDTTYSDKNGWHYHKHMLFFVDLQDATTDDMRDAMDETLTEWWLDCLNEHGLSGKDEYALNVSNHENASSDYMAKIGLTTDESGNLHYEMTSATTKDGGRNIWDILMLANIGSIKNELLYIEYVAHMTGKNWITWSHGLHDIVDNFEIEETEPETGQDNKMVKWLLISDYWWDIVKWAYGYAELLDVAARTRDIWEVRGLLYVMRDNLRHENKLSDYYINYIPEIDSIADIRVHEDWQNDTS